ncbi:MAG: GerMN domain-containing protein [Candidatus Paceibacterota bacterium]|jgi:hypothetical protein
MKKQYLFAVAVIFVIGASLAVFFSLLKGNALIPIPAQTRTEEKTEEPPAVSAKGALFQITSPKKGETIQSPFTVRGSAKGTWYFEASFPIKVVDSNGKLIGRGVAQAEGDWMTEQLVPFSGTILFSGKEGEKGEMIFEKDNPSGLPENADELRVPVLFGEATTPVAVYFGNAKDGINEDCSKVFSVTRYVPKTTAVARSALLELLKGPTDTDKKEGFFTSINEGVRIQKLTIEDGTASVDFSDEIERAVGGSCRVTSIRAQIERTLLQFKTIESVIISVDGRTEDVLQP